MNATPTPIPHRTSRRSIALTVLAGALVALACFDAPVHAQSGVVPATLEGTWVYDGTIAAAVRVVNAAFAPAIATFPELFQGFARSRLETSMAPPRRVLVTLASGRVRVSLESSERTVVVDGNLGSHATVSGAEGTPVVTPNLRSGWLELFYEGEGSELRQLLSTEPDGLRMHLDFTVVSPQLPGPVRYRLDYVHPAG
jgi:hypothetical protein